MDEGFRCRRCGFEDPTVSAVSEVLLAIGRERSTQAVFRQIVEAVRRLASARCAALAILGDDGGLAQLVTSGMPADAHDQIAHRSSLTGLLEAVIEDARPLRVPVMSEDPRHTGVPDALVEMGAFMGVPLVSDGSVVGAFAVFGREGAPSFTAAEHEAVSLLASHAILAVENARLDERSRELTVIEERNRLARELHDAVSQTLFSIVLMAGSAAALIKQDPDAACDHVGDLQHLAQEAQHEMRSLIFELRPAEIERDGLVSTLRKHVDVLRRVYPAEIDLAVDGERSLPPKQEREIFRVAQEALSNALKHAAATRVRIELSMPVERVELRIGDDGKGFEPVAAGASAKRFGLTSMRERVEALGGTIAIDSSPGRGTTVTVEVPDGR